MKKILFSAAVVLMSAAAYAQLSVGVQSTGSLSTAKVKSQYDDLQFSTGSRVMPGAGVVVEYAFGDRFSLRSGVEYLQKGTTLDFSIEGFSKSEMKSRLQYIQVPLHAVYNFPSGNNSFYIGLGGYAAYGVKGYLKYHNQYTMPDGNINEETEKIKAFTKDDEDGAGFKRADFGLSSIAGYRLNNGVYFQAGYQYGLTNLDRSGGDSYKNRGFGISIGYFFHKRK